MRQSDIAAKAPKADLVKFLTIVLQRNNSRQITIKVQHQKPNAVLRTIVLSNIQKPNALPIEKPTEKGRYTPYHLKPFISCSGTKQYLATIEAVSAQLSALVLGVDFAPKVRVAANQSQETKPRLLSKSIQNYIPALQLDDLQISHLIRYKRREVVKLFLKIFCFAEPDLHANGNWGINVDTKKIVNVDHGRAFSSFSALFSSPNERVGGETDVFLLSRYPHLVYTTDTMLNIISADDINNMPLFNDLRPYNTPFSFIKPELLQKLHALRTNEEFIRWKFFYLTKYLLLITPTQVKKIVASHSIAADDSDDRFCCEILKRRAIIQEVLFSIPEYRQFLDITMPKLQNELQQEIAKYNLLFCDENETPKPHKQHHIIPLESTLETLRELQQEACKTSASETLENARNITLEIARIKRDMLAFYNCDAGIRQQENLWDTAQSEWGDSILNKMPHELSDGDCLPVLRFLQQRNLLQDFEVFKNNLPLPLKFFFLHPTETVRSMRDRAMKDFVERTEILVRQYGAILSENQLLETWNTVKENDFVNHKNFLLIYCNYYPLEKIPAMIRIWLLENIECIQQTNLVTRQHSMFTALIKLVDDAQRNVSVNASYTVNFFGVYELPIHIVSEKLLAMLRSPTVDISLSPNDYEKFYTALADASNLNTDICNNLCCYGEQDAGDAVLVVLRYENGRFMLTSSVQLCSSEVNAQLPPEHPTTPACPQAFL